MTEQAEPSSTELTALISKVCHLTGPQLEDNLHVPSVSAEELIQIKQVLKWEQSLFQSWMFAVQHPHGEPGKLQAGHPPGDASGPSQELL